MGYADFLFQGLGYGYIDYKCDKSAVMSGRTYGIDSGYLDARLFVQSGGKRAIPCSDDDHSKWRRICQKHGWPAHPPHSQEEVQAARRIQRAFRRYLATRRPREK